MKVVFVVVIESLLVYVQLAVFPHKNHQLVVYGD